ncbi:MAG TPA: response regulator [Ruminiclostridium sp.]
MENIFLKSGVDLVREMKVMLVDDEILAINYLKNLIPWSNYGYKIIAESTNSIKAIDIFKETHPDIIIVDICMPGIDGLEFSSRVLSEGWAVKIILLTSYRDFKYAKQAVELGVSNYLLKNEINTDTLIKELEKIKEALENENKDERIIRRQAIRDILDGKKISEKDEKRFYLHECKDSKFVFLLAKIDRPFPIIEFEKSVKSRIFETNLWDYIQLPEKVDFLEAIEFDSNMWGILCSTDKILSQRQLSEKTYSIALVIQRKFKEKHDQTISIVHSNVFNDINDLGGICEELKKEIEFSIFEGKEKIIRPREINLLYTSNLASICTELEAVSKTLEKLDVDGTCMHLDTIFSSSISKKCDIKSFKFICQELINILDKFRINNHLKSISEFIVLGEIASEKWYTAAGIHQWFIEEYEISLSKVLKSKKFNYSKKVLLVMNYIHEHYSEDISIMDIGEKLNMSGDHLRHAFKEETGQTILDYITFNRIEKAKELIKDGKYKIYEISEMVGYKTSQYFSQVFKRTLGINPMEFAERKVTDNETKY